MHYRLATLATLVCDIMEGRADQHFIGKGVLTTFWAIIIIIIKLYFSVQVI